MTEGLVMAPDHYVVLGVPRDANLSQIRRAFRELAHQHDPDHANDPRPFQQVEAAYESLITSAERAEHDRALGAEGAGANPAVQPDLGPPRDLLDDYADHRPSREQMILAFQREYLGPLRKSHPMREVGVDVALRPDQAQTGGVVAFNVPAATLCAACDGTGRTGFFHCDACGGNGATWTRARVDVVVPTGAGSGMRIPVSLAPAGAHNLYLNVTIRTRPDGPFSV